MKLEYIKANGVYWRPQKPGVQDPDKIEGCYYPSGIEEIKFTK